MISTDLNRWPPISTVGNKRAHTIWRLWKECSCWPITSDGCIVAAFADNITIREAGGREKFELWHIEDMFGLGNFDWGWRGNCWVWGIMWGWVWSRGWVLDVVLGWFGFVCIFGYMCELKFICCVYENVDLWVKCVIVREIMLF